MQYIIVDGMKTEGKIFRNLMILGYTFTILMPLSLNLVNYLIKSNLHADKKILLFTIAFFLVGSMGLYGWLYAVKYQIKITKDVILLRTLFNKEEIIITDIISYTCVRYRKSVFYQFELCTKQKSVLIYTRYKEDFIQLLSENEIVEQTF